MFKDKMMFPISRKQLQLLRGQKETAEEINNKKIYHIIDPIYNMVVFTARIGITKSYHYKIGYISEEQLETVEKSLRSLFPDCTVHSTTTTDYECGGSSPNVSTSIIVDWC